MGGGRKNLKRAVEEESFNLLQQGQSVMQVVDLRGSNLIEVMDSKGEKSLAIFPAKFQKSMWIKRGSFVSVDESGRDEATECGRKVGCVVTQVLFFEQIRALRKSPEWPEIFRSTNLETAKEDSAHALDVKGNEESSDDDGLPPLEANTNRIRPFQPQSDTESDSDSSSNS